MKPDRPSMYFDEPAVLAKSVRLARSEHALGDHGVGDLHEAGCVGAEHQITSWPYSLAASKELATMFSMMDLSLPSTSSKVQERR